jgi:dihydroorotate dehydrogenase
MADLCVKIAGVALKNPVITASGTFGFGREYNALYPLSRLGGISCKGTTLHERLGNLLHALRKRHPASSTALACKIRGWMRLFVKICPG